MHTSIITHRLPCTHNYTVHMHTHAHSLSGCSCEQWDSELSSTTEKEGEAQGTSRGPHPSTWVPSCLQALPGAPEPFPTARGCGHCPARALLPTPAALWTIQGPPNDQACTVCTGTRTSNMLLWALHRRATYGPGLWQSPPAVLSTPWLEPLCT